MKVYYRNSGSLDMPPISSLKFNVDFTIYIGTLRFIPKQ